MKKKKVCVESAMSILTMKQSRVTVLLVLPVVVCHMRVVMVSTVRLCLALWPRATVRSRW